MSGQYSIDDLADAPSHAASTGSNVLDFTAGVGGQIAQDATGIYDLLRRIPGADRILPDSAAFHQAIKDATPDTTASHVGQIVAGGLEYLMPASKAAELTKGAGLLTRMGAQALAAGGVRMAQTGGDIPSSIDAAALGAAGPLVGDAAGAASRFAAKALVNSKIAKIAPDLVGMISPRAGNVLRVAGKVATAAGETAAKAGPTAESAAAAGEGLTSASTSDLIDEITRRAGTPPAAAASPQTAAPTLKLWPKPALGTWEPGPAGTPEPTAHWEPPVPEPTPTTTVGPALTAAQRIEDAADEQAAYMQRQADEIIWANRARKADRFARYLTDNKLDPTPANLAKATRAMAENAPPSAETVPMIYDRMGYTEPAAAEGTSDLEQQLPDSLAAAKAKPGAATVSDAKALFEKGKAAFEAARKKP